MLRFRHNVMSVTSLDAFEMIKGGINNNCKDVYFVRAIGTNASYISDIQRMDDALLRSMNEERCYYQRIGELPKLQSIETSYFYAECYDKWAACDKREMITKVTEKNTVLAGMLGAACVAVEELAVKGKEQITESIIRNMIVKMLFWYDSVFADNKFQWDEKRSVKLVFSNIAKRQEYLFCYLVTLMGCDVLLLQSRADIDAAEEGLELSAKFVLGAFAEIDIPAYKWRETRETKRLKTTIEQNAAQVPNIPSDANAMSATAEVRNVGENGSGNRIRMQIPRHAGRRESTSNTVPVQTTVNAISASAPSVNVTSMTTTSMGGSEVVEKSFEELALLASSVVLIAIHDSKGEPIGSGSGIMIGRNGYILTNNHVAAGGRFYSVRIEDDEQVYRTDEIIKYNQLLDLAIIRIQRTLNPLKVYQGQKPLVRGQKVVAIGSPLGLFNSVSNGIISGFRNIDNVDMIQFTAPTSHGSSGGAVLNMQGEVIGISTAGFDSGQNINLAVGYEGINMFIRGFTG